MLDGTIDGTPPIDDAVARARWIEVCTAEYQAVRGGDGGGVLRSYAGTNPGEFFAVATEVFFTQPLPLQVAKPALYEVLMGYYRQDPAARLRTFLQERAEQAAPPTSVPHR
jgi:Mlc titration factor MtfA (ptsG expression regulator)